MNFRFWRKKRIRAREFVLEDATGRERAALRMDGADNTLLHFRDMDGRTRCFMGVTPYGTPRISFNYGNGKGTIELEANDELDTASLILTSPHGRAKIVLVITAGGLPGILVYDERGAPRSVILHAAAPEEPLPEGGSIDWDSFFRH